MPDIYTLRLWAVAFFAVWGALDICRRLIALADRDDLDAIDRQERVKRSLSDVTRGRHGR